LVISKEDVLKLFEVDLTDPGSEKSGEYLAEHVLLRARRILSTDRAGLIEALQAWLQMKRDPETMLAVNLVGERNALDELKNAIVQGKAFRPFYTKRVDEALQAIS